MERDHRDSCVSDFVFSQKQRLDVLEGAQLRDVLISDFFVGKVDFFCLFGDCDVFDGDKGDWSIFPGSFDGGRLEFDLKFERDVVDGVFEFGVGF